MSMADDYDHGLDTGDIESWNRRDDGYEEDISFEQICKNLNNRTKKRSSNMQVTGTILAVQQRIDNNTNAQMSWSAHGKTFYTFDMTVRGPNADVSGEISSTSVGVYPKAVGDMITVDSFEQNGWPKLKAISDQQQQRGGQSQQAPPTQQQPQHQAFQQGGQTNYPPQQQAPYTPTSQAPPQNQRSTQECIQFGQSLNLADQEYVSGVIKECQMERRVNMWLNIIKTQQFPSFMREDTPQQPASQQQAPPPQQEAPPQQQFDINPALDEEIPF